MKANERAILKSLFLQPVASLATLHGGEPAISMVPFALLPGSTGFVIHVSGLASHTRDMLDRPAVALLMTAPADAADTPLALPRASVQGEARRCDADSAEYQAARAAYLAKLPDAEELFSFRDFSLFVIAPRTVRFVAGFGRAMTLTAGQLAELMSDDAAADA
ncbi:pyridoxamine 5'-phosphate oxidase family protein [Niveibacterium sp. SC-1]|uniref:pyridoxamine 5'-phosphate oxidase family protein n=1 Tax=Niveibacterium sp. SC-1 TaxID=3135646 RepID=UPI00312053F3